MTGRWRVIGFLMRWCSFCWGSPASKELDDTRVPQVANQNCANHGCHLVNLDALRLRSGDRSPQNGEVGKTNLAAVESELIQLQNSTAPLDLVRKALGEHEIALVQTTALDESDANRAP